MGSIALATEKVNVSSPSISAAINQLENEFGLPLFVRQHAQGLSLTLAGRQILEQAKTVLEDAERLVDLAADISGNGQGPLSIGGLLTFAQVVVPALRASFEARYPYVRVTQHELDQAQIFNMLRRSDMAVMRSLVANGFGFSIANVRPLNDLSPNGKPLRFIPLEGDARPMRMGLLTSPTAESVNVIRAFVEHCKSEHADGHLPGLNLQS